MAERFVYVPQRALQRPLLELGRRARYVGVEGPIGVGKTTLSRMLGERVGARTMLEVVEENPFLHRFYQDIRAHAFQTQVFFLMSRYRQQQEVRRLVAAGEDVVSDYIFAKDRLFARMNLDRHELDLYDEVYEAISPRTARPDLVIFLRASLDTLMQRVRTRDRAFERELSREYMARLVDAYDAFFVGYTDTPLLVVDTDQVDIFRAADLDELLGYVAEAVA